jgi:hypothetical protein
MNMVSKFKHHRDYLEVSFFDESTFSNLNKLLDQIVKECKKKNHKKVMVDLLNVKGSLSEIDRFKIGEKIAQLFPIPYRMLAIVKEERINRFGENTAVNRGANLHVASNKKDGLDWLLEKK